MSVQLHALSTSGERALGTYQTGGWVGPKLDPVVVAKKKVLPLPEIEPRSSSQ